MSRLTPEELYSQMEALADYYYDEVEECGYCPIKLMSLNLYLINATVNLLNGVSRFNRDTDDE